MCPWYPWWRPLASKILFLLGVSLTNVSGTNVPQQATEMEVKVPGPWTMI